MTPASHQPNAASKPSLWRRALRSRVVRWGLGLPALAVLTLYLGLVGALKVGELAAGRERPLSPAVHARSTEPHTLTLVDDGPTSLAQRLALIDSAKRSLELEFFIFELDLASRLVAQKLAEKARQGVRVRLLVDFSLAVFELGPAYAHHLARSGVEVRYYNTSAAYRLLAVQHRSHRKLLIVDDEVVMSGGRNIGDDYFHLSPHFNFLDADVVVRGPIAQQVRATFDRYWTSELAAKPDDAPPTPEERRLARAFVDTTPGDRATFAFVAEHGPRLLSKLRHHTCRDLTFATDFPGVAESNRRVYQVLTGVFAEARERVLGESPYVVLRGDGLAQVRALGERGVAVTLLSNSLHSTDAYYTVSALRATLGTLATTRLNLWAYSGAAPPQQLQLPLPQSTRWGVHAKRAVVDDRHVLIGTFNVDPRSANLNSELLFVCRDHPALAAEMRASIEARIARSKPVLADGVVHTDHLLGDAPWSARAKMTLAIPLAWAFDFLL